MRILNIEAGYFVQTFRSLGHEVVHIGSKPDCDVVLDKPLSARALFELLRSRGFWPDLALWADGCRPPAVLGLELLPCVSIGYSIDQYCNPWHVPWSASFDHILLAQKDYTSLFELSHLSRKVEWFPLFFNPHGLEEEGDRDIPVGFVGTITGSINRDRKYFLDAFRTQAPLVVRSGSYYPIYGRSRIVLNQSAAGEVNFRIFEGAGCGALVVTERVANGLDDLFVLGEEVAVYERGNPADAARVCRDLLADPHCLRRMAGAGRRRVMRDHTAAARAKRILDVARQLAPERPWEWRKAHAKRIAQELGKMCVFLGMDQELPLPWDMAQGYLRMGMSRLR